MDQSSGKRDERKYRDHRYIYDPQSLLPSISFSIFSATTYKALRKKKKKEITPGFWDKANIRTRFTYGIGFGIIIRCFI